jgi:hypothetical protein
MLQRLMAIEPPSQKIPFPRKNADGAAVCDVVVRVLTQSQIESCCANAEQHVRLLFKGKLEAAGIDEIKAVRAEAWSEAYENAKLVELLFEACRDPDEPKRPLFSGPTEIRKLLTADECASLFQAYATIQEQNAPLISELSEAELEDWITTLAKGAAHAPLWLLAHGAQTQLLTYMASQLRSSKIGTGSPSLPSDDTQSSTSA